MPAPLHVFMLVKTLPEWLAMAPAERFAALDHQVKPILGRHAPAVTLRFFDTEFYSARVTDVWLWRAETHAAFHALVEDLRETPFWDRYFAIVEILPGIEEAFAAHYGVEGVGTASD